MERKIKHSRRTQRTKRTKRTKRTQRTQRTQRTKRTQRTRRNRKPVRGGHSTDESPNYIVHQHLLRTQGEDINIEDLATEDLTTILANILADQSRVVAYGVATSPSVKQAKRLIKASIFLMMGDTIDDDRIHTYATRLVERLDSTTTT